MARINQLVNSATLNATDVLAKDAASGGTTNKITAQNLANGVKTLGSLVSTTEMNAAIEQSTANIGDTSSTVTGASSKGTISSGGAYTVGKLLVIQFIFNAISSSTNTPGIANIHKSLPCEAALTAIDITSGIGSAITSGVPCGVSTLGIVYIKELVMDHIYAISGVVRCG